MKIGDKFKIFINANEVRAKQFSYSFTVFYGDKIILYDSIGTFIKCHEDEGDNIIIEWFG